MGKTKMNSSFDEPNVLAALGSMHPSDPIGTSAKSNVKTVFVQVNVKRMFTDVDGPFGKIKMEVIHF